MIETQNVIVDAHHAAWRPSMKEGKYVLLAVSDSGVNERRDQKARIFEPFLHYEGNRQKARGPVSRTVLRLVNQSSGFIHVDSTPGKRNSV